MVRRSSSITVHFFSRRCTVDYLNQWRMGIGTHLHQKICSKFIRVIKSWTIIGSKNIIMLQHKLCGQVNNHIRMYSWQKDSTAHVWSILVKRIRRKWHIYSNKSGRLDFYHWSLLQQMREQSFTLMEHTQFMLNARDIHEWWIWWVRVQWWVCWRNLALWPIDLLKLRLCQRGNACQNEHGSNTFVWHKMEQLWKIYLNASQQELYNVKEELAVTDRKG